ncbi:MAG: peptide ABC transporter substrate-binding protein [Chloroflexaceae bacterium]|nr:peptide ABC transporter substrate-binding protein [Chloroflexaceae bacterium]
MSHTRKFLSFAGLLLLALLVPILAACGSTPAPAEPAGEPEVVTVVVTAEPQVVEQTVVVEATADPNAEPVAEPIEEEPAAGAEEWTTPHPILGDIRVRQALAYCTDRSALISSVYPFLDDQEREALLMNTFLPQGHWALASDDQITVYPFDPEQGNTLLEEAGWTQEAPGTPRVNEAGEQLSIKFTTTDAVFRQTWAAVLEQQLIENCGVQIIRTHAPGSWWFGNTTGLQRRDFELGAYAWVGEADPGGNTLYACNQIPVPANNWEGQNYMGWCNEEASRAIFAANNLLDREARVEQYAIVQRAFTEDMISLPLFNRFEAAAANTNLLNFRPNPTNDYVANINEWELADGGDTVVIGFTQEPASLWLVVEDASVANIASSILKTVAATSYDYDYQAKALTDLPTIENGGTVLEVVEIGEGDIVWTTQGEAVELSEGVELVNAEGELVTFAGEPVEVNQLSVTFEFPQLTWEDGEPVKAADFELLYRIDCDPESGAISLTFCESIESVDFTSDTAYTINYLPGVQWPEYFVQTLGLYSNLYSIGAYPSHQVLSDESAAQVGLPAGSTLADVPASEWSTLPEVAERPLSYGPYRLVEWQKGQRIVYEANPFYYAGEPTVKTVIIEFFDDTNQAVAQLLTGNVDVLGTETLGAGPELETVLQAGDAGDLQVFPLTSPTWEHMDMNLFIR